VLSQVPGLLARHRLQIVAAAVGLVVVTAACAVWLVVRAQQARDVVSGMQADGRLVQKQLAAYDLTAAGGTLTRLRAKADRAHSITGDPVWWIASHVPAAGQDVGAARNLAAAFAHITEAAQPLETALPRLDPKVTATRKGALDVEALSSVAGALPAVNESVNQAGERIGDLDPDQLSPQIATGVRTAKTLLATISDPLAGLAPSMELVPTMLGKDKPRTWLFLLQQGAEARGTGGLVGAYAVVRTDRGRMDLVTATQRQTLQRRSAIPRTAVPEDLRKLWGKDLSEWAGLNLSPHYPWTGQLVAAGWEAGKNSPPLDYVAAIDQGTVAALLSATGPVTVRGDRISQDNAVEYLTKDIYARYPNPHDVDRVTAELVEKVFGRVAAGRLDLTALIQNMGQPVRERRLLVWSSDRQQQQALEDLTIGGAIPDRAGPFAMAVVNNGGGNKLDAYLKVKTQYQPGPCSEGMRVGNISVTLSSLVPKTPLPSYVTERNDLEDRGLRNRVVGSNRILLDVYGPVGSTSPVTTLDGDKISVIKGVDRKHSVWRAIVPINPGQSRTVNVFVAQPKTLDIPTNDVTVLTQPMAIPAIATAGTLSACG
jgi:hypothetical protein